MLDAAALRALLAKEWQRPPRRREAVAHRQTVMDLSERRFAHRQRGPQDAASRWRAWRAVLTV